MSYVTVRNDHWLDVAVYAVRSGARFRLGTVSGLGTETLRLPEALVRNGTTRLLIDPIGSNEQYLTDQILVERGQRVALTVASVISMSNFVVRNR